MYNVYTTTNNLVKSYPNRTLLLLKSKIIKTTTKMHAYLLTKLAKFVPIYMLTDLTINKFNKKRKKVLTKIRNISLFLN